MNRVLTIMILIRVFSSLIELSAAGLMYYFKSIETAVRINAVLGLLGPVILMTVSFIGLIGLSSQLSAKNLIIVATGVFLIILGTR